MNLWHSVNSIVLKGYRIALLSHSILFNFWFPFSHISVDRMNKLVKHLKLYISQRYKTRDIDNHCWWYLGLNIYTTYRLEPFWTCKCWISHWSIQSLSFPSFSFLANCLPFPLGLFLYCVITIERRQACHPCLSHCFDYHHHTMTEKNIAPQHCQKTSYFTTEK